MKEIKTDDIGIKLRVTSVVKGRFGAGLNALYMVRRQLADQLAHEILSSDGGFFRYTDVKPNSCAYTVDAIVLSEMQLAQIKQQAFEEGVEWMRNGMAMPC
jgi:predicted NUDIX family NTP pyrophosphohydrolase